MPYLKKIVKLCFILVAILIPGILIAGIAAFFLVDSHDFKPQLIQLTEEKLGRKLEVQGEFSLQFYPEIALKLTQAHLKNPDTFGALKNNDFAYVDTVKLKMAFLPLLKGQMNIKQLTLEGLKLHLTRLAPNQDNWSDLVTQIKDTAKNKETPENSEVEELKKGKFTLKLDETQLYHAELLYQDKAANKTYQLKNLNFSAQKISPEHATEIKGDCIFIADMLKTNMAYQAQMQFNPKQSKLTLNALTLKSTLISNKLPGGKLESNLSGSLKADWKNQQFTLENLILKFNDTVAKGLATIDFSAGLSAQFKLGLNHFKLDNYLPDTHLTLTEIQTQGKFNNQVLTLLKLKANLYSGRFQGSSQIKFAPQNQYQIKGQLDQVNIQALLSDLKNIQKISGSAHATLNLSTVGNNASMLKQNLNGTINIDLQKGALHGVDVEYYLNKAQVLAKKLPADTAMIDHKKTPFDKLTGNFTFQNGLISNQDLQGFSSFYDLSGAGTIDLKQEQIQYKLKAISLKSDGSQRKLPLAVIISGPLSHPNIMPDMQTYLQGFIQDKIQDKIQKQLQKKLGISSIPHENNHDNHNNTEAIDKKALQKELLNKGLQKLFGK